MLKEVQFIRSLGYEMDTNQLNYLYKIIDTDFEEAVLMSETVALRFGVINTIIDYYSKRDLPIAPNVIRYMLQIRDKYGWSLDGQVEYNKKYNSRWHEVEKDMQMYLLLS